MPENAAGFALIPFFHLYWLYVAFRGLYEDMNKATESYGLDARFDGKFITRTCHAWVVLFVFECLGGLLGVPTRMIIIATLLHTGITLRAYWRIRKDVLEFIDIKSSVRK